MTRPQPEPAVSSQPWHRKPVVVAAGVAVFVAVVGGTMTDTGPWYRSLSKSEWTPPDWMFGPVWTLIYALCVVAVVKVWPVLENSRARAWALSLFFLNALLNLLWSFVFFTLRRPDWAMAEVGLLWLSVLSLILLTWPRQRTAAVALVPYLLWVGLAAYLNFEVVRRNGPFV